MQINSPELLAAAIKGSNEIEGEEDTGRYHSNHVIAANAALTAAEHGQVIHPTALHYMLFHDLWRPEQRAGTFRQVDVGVNTGTGGFRLFAPWQRVPGLMDDWWELLLDYTTSLPRLRRKFPDAAWQLHAEFESIHPFEDGNGRAGRLVWWAIRAMEGDPIEVIDLSNRFEYYDRLELWRTANPMFHFGKRSQ